VPEDTRADIVGLPDTAVTDTAPDVPLGPCTKLDPNPPTIFVDGRATRDSNGTADCPAKTIGEGLALVAGLPSGKRTIKVAGAPGGLTYDEKGALVVKFNTTIVGDDSAKVIVTGGGACGTSGAQCVFIMEGGSSLESVTIDSKGPRIGILATPGFLTTASLKSLLVTGSTGDKNMAVGMSGAGTLDINSDVRVTKNTGPGVYVISGRLNAKTPFAGTPSHFDENLAGIVVDGTGSCDLENVTASKNVTHGVALIATTKDGANNIGALTANDNGANGVFVEVGASLKMRRSTLVRNRVGLQFRFGPTNTLDLGTAAFLDKGGNTFGGKTVFNTKAGICLPFGRAGCSDAQGNMWSGCSPTNIALPGEACDGTGSYQDVWFNGTLSAGKPPLTFGDCTTGP